MAYDKNQLSILKDDMNKILEKVEDIIKGDQPLNIQSIYFFNSEIDMKRAKLKNECSNFFNQTEINSYTLDSNKGFSAQHTFFALPTQDKNICVIEKGIRSALCISHENVLVNINLMRKSELYGFNSVGKDHIDISFLKGSYFETHSKIPIATVNLFKEKLCRLMNKSNFYISNFTKEEFLEFYRRKENNLEYAKAKEINFEEFKGWVEFIALAEDRAVFHNAVSLNKQDINNLLKNKV